MIESRNYEQIKADIFKRIKEDKTVLDQLRAEIRVLRSQVRRIQPRTTTSISLVGTDGGNNKLKFDPFLIQIIRVVDSSNNEYYIDVITPTTNIEEIEKRIFDKSDNRFIALREMMEYLCVDKLSELSHMIRPNTDNRPVSPSWVQVYRELVEWATLFRIIRKKDFGTDTLIVFDGLLRSKVFAKNLFAKYRQGLEEGIEQQLSNNRRIYVAGLAKHSKVLERYRLAMFLEGILTNSYPCYVEIPRDLEEKAYIWSEYARGDDRQLEGITEINKFVAGKMYFVKFGNGTMDPIWPVDILQSQRGEAQNIIGYMLADAISGFPIPFYPLSLQKAHENAALVDFDFDVIQDHIFDAIRNALANEGQIIDIFRLQESDPSNYRY